MVYCHRRQVLNCGHVVVREFMLGMLRHWALEYGVDGFCFLNAENLVQGGPWPAAAASAAFFSWQAAWPQRYLSQGEPPPHIPLPHALAALLPSVVRLPCWHLPAPDLITTQTKQPAARLVLGTSQSRTF
jgi:hypothetical protein